MSQQGLRQASVRAVTGSAETYEGDWHRLFTLSGITTGNTDATGVFRPATFDERFLLWINFRLSRTFTNLPEAMQAFAAAAGAFNWSSLGTFDAGVATGVPVNTVLPSIGGIQTVGQVVTASNGSWTNFPTSFTYQWKKGGVNIGGATASTYLLVSGDAGALIIVTVTASNVGFGAGAPATSAAITPAAVLAISGTPSPTATNGSPYSFTPSASGGHTTYVFSLTGTLPAGLSLNPATGAITGTPTVDGVSSGLSITVTDADGLTASLPTFSITVSTAPPGVGSPIGLLMALTKAA